MRPHHILSLFIHKLLSDRQHAFRKSHSCETQLATVIDDWAKILDNQGQVDTFILEFEKAFDTPPHELLKSKLFSYGIGGKTIKWIDAFLCSRQQRVVVNGVKSDWAPVVSGVPQGTVLGPLLFSLQINDITSDIESEIRLFADDCPPPFRRKAEGHSFWLSVLPSVPLQEYVPCVRNSSYSFIPILLKLYRCLHHALKMCMWFGYNPQINF